MITTKTHQFNECGVENRFLNWPYLLCIYYIFLIHLKLFSHLTSRLLVLLNLCYIVQSPAFHSWPFWGLARSSEMFVLILATAKLTHPLG